MSDDDDDAGGGAAAEEAEAWTDTDIDGQIMAAPCRAARSLARSLGHSCGTALLFSHVESGQAGVRMGLNQCRSSLGPDSREIKEHGAVQVRRKWKLAEAGDGEARIRE